MKWYNLITAKFSKNLVEGVSRDLLQGENFNLQDQSRFSQQEESSFTVFTNVQILVFEFSTNSLQTAKRKFQLFKAFTVNSVGKRNSSYANLNFYRFKKKKKLSEALKKKKRNVRSSYDLSVLVSFVDETIMLKI